MSEIAFRFDDVIREIRAFETIGEEFIRPESMRVLHSLEAQLLIIRSRKLRGVTCWGISESDPLRTRTSDGEYEPRHRSGRLKVHAEISSRWEVYCPDERTKKASPQGTFILSGLASTRVEIICHEDGKECPVATWHVDIGDADSPGCHFHVQVQQEDEDTMFPKSLSVPRFPSILVTPTAVCEFVISELFQSGWLRYASKRSSAMSTWNDVQLPRFERLLEWHQKVLRESTTSPWTHLKATKPKYDLFVP